LVIADEASRWCAVVLHFQRHPIRLRPELAIGERHETDTRLLMQASRELFVCTRAARADLPLVRHTALAGHRLVVHPQAEGEVTLRRKRCPRRLLLTGDRVDPDRGGNEQQREGDLRADDERQDAAELLRADY